MRLTSIKSKEFGQNQELFDELIKKLREDFARYKDQKIKFVVGNVSTNKLSSNFFHESKNCDVNLAEVAGTLLLHSITRASRNSAMPSALLSMLMSEE